MPRQSTRLLVRYCIAWLAATAPAQAATTADLVGAVSQANLETSVAALEGERADGADRLAAALWIESTLDGYGYDAERWDVFGVLNVVATLPGTRTPDEVVVIGAHFDTVFGSPGADDNASGVAGMLEIARVFAAHPQPATLVFVAFDVEEYGYDGSRIFADDLRRLGRTVRAMVSLEMIGYRCFEPDCQFPFGNLGTCFRVSTVGVNVGTFIALVANEASEALLNAFVAGAIEHVPALHVEWAQVRGNGSCFSATRRSDHASFWDVGFPGMMLTDTAEYRNKNYHTAFDTIDTLDFAFATDVTRATTAWAVAMAAPEPSAVGAALAGVLGLVLAARRR